MDENTNTDQHAVRHEDTAPAPVKRTPINCYLNGLAQYAKFDGRIARHEYWWFALFHALVLLVLLSVDHLFGLESSKTGMGPLSACYILLTLIPGIGMAVRRLHDSDHKGWWVLIGFIPLPFIPTLIMIIFLVLKSTEGRNRFGNQPE